MTLGIANTAANDLGSGIAGLGFTGARAGAHDAPAPGSAADLLQRIGDARTVTERSQLIGLLDEQTGSQQASNALLHGGGSERPISAVGASDRSRAPDQDHASCIRHQSPRVTHSQHVTHAQHVIAAALARTGYATAARAAYAALHEANPRSIRDNREYGGLVYKTSNGTYVYTKPSTGTGASFNPHGVSIPKGATVVGDYHTHGDYSTADASGNPVRTTNPKLDQFNSNQFSTTDLQGVTADARNKKEYHGYLGTPSGRFLVFDPSTNTVGNLR